MSNADNFPMGSNRTDALVNKWSDATSRSVSCYNNIGSIVSLLGCPTELPITIDGKILAGRIYRETGNDIPQLACNGPCGNWYAESKFTQAAGGKDPFGSIIINPGCTLHIFSEYNYAGQSRQYTGPGVYPNPKVEKPIVQNCGVPCIASMLWTCQQTYPSCTPSDSWQTVTEIDNSQSSLSALFTYEKTVGTTFSQEMKESRSVSATVSASIEASFWGVTATLGVSATTGYDWGKTDTETRSESKTFDVQVKVPPQVKMQIQEAVGTCGGSTIHTQMFRILDTGTSASEPKVIKTFKGMMKTYKLSRKDFKG